MTEILTAIELPPPFPDHTQLPDKDDNFVKNFQEHPQSIILTDSLTPVLEQLHPDGQYAIGQDCGIYWRETDPPQAGAVAPDWFYVPNVPPKLDGLMRRSYVLWRELRAPLIALEFASGNGDEERDKTPLAISPSGSTQKPGKFWVYENVIRMPYYGIFEIQTGQLSMYHLVDFTYYPIEPNDRGHYPIPQLGVELGLWQGTYQNQEQVWLRWWDAEGNLLLTGWERVEIERAATERERLKAEAAQQQAEQERTRAEAAQQQAEQERTRAEAAQQQAEQERQKAARLADRLRALGVDPDQL
ncbi:Uma2 family endonuclease [[Phormidium] sp. ETS-05]|uniref:Uma2 family endonuclease n=1 Tax=[Phormidium] sp. ETS-05 TaxID=222819 RepID=UPI0018EF351F|nr:Uma2 family endonuclease [[Phormidium] sp. ETS-05]